MKRLKYLSSFTKPMSHAEIEALVQESARNNALQGITGVLMTSGNLFFQIIEGPKQQIDELYSKIISDHRHTNVLLLSAEEAVPNRIFPDWSMRRIDLGDESVLRLEPLRAILDTIIDLRKTIEMLSKTLERSIWGEMVSQI